MWCVCVVCLRSVCVRSVGGVGGARVLLVCVYVVCVLGLSVAWAGSYCVCCCG